MKLSRRLFLSASFTTLAGTAIGSSVIGLKGGLNFMSTEATAKAASAKTTITPITRTDDEWRKLLTSEQYRVLRKEGTERSGASPLNAEKRAGTFHCAGCDLALFDTATKFESGTGWPSFYDHLPDAVATKTDYWIGYPRTEYHCARCGGHQGHVFKDGPQPTGLRYCNNGVALNFKPKEDKAS